MDHITKKWQFNCLNFFLLSWDPNLAASEKSKGENITPVQYMNLEKDIFLWNEVIFITAVDLLGDMVITVVKHDKMTLLANMFLEMHQPWHHKYH